MFLILSKYAFDLFVSSLVDNTDQVERNDLSLIINFTPVAYISPF